MPRLPMDQWGAVIRSCILSGYPFFLSTHDCFLLKLDQGYRRKALDWGEHHHSFLYTGFSEQQPTAYGNMHKCISLSFFEYRHNVNMKSKYNTCLVHFFIDPLSCDIRHDLHFSIFLPLSCYIRLQLAWPCNRLSLCLTILISRREVIFIMTMFSVVFVELLIASFQMEGHLPSQVTHYVYDVGN